VIALTVHLRKVVVGELTPLFFDLAFGLFPISFDAVPVHRYLRYFVVFALITLADTGVFP
jgi:hypothetical protein